MDQELNKHNSKQLLNSKFKCKLKPNNSNIHSHIHSHQQGKMLFGWISMDFPSIRVLLGTGDLSISYSTISITNKYLAETYYSLPTCPRCYT